MIGEAVMMAMAVYAALVLLAMFIGWGRTTWESMHERIYSARSTRKD